LYKFIYKMKENHIGKYYEELPANYTLCNDINNFLTIDLKEHTFKLVGGINYLIFIMNKYFIKDTFVYECEATNLIILGKLKKYIEMGIIYIELQPLYLTLQSNTEIPEELFITKYINYLVKANKEKKLQIKEGIAAYDFKFDHPPYTIYIFKKTGKSNLIFHHIVEGVYKRTKDDISYVIEHMLKCLPIK